MYSSLYIKIYNCKYSRYFFKPTRQDYYQNITNNFLTKSNKEKRNYLKIYIFQSFFNPNFLYA